MAYTRYSPLLSKKPALENAPSNNGPRSGTWHGHRTLFNSMPRAGPLTVLPSLMPSASPPLAAITHCGTRQWKSKETTWATKRGNPNTPGTPRPQPCNWPLTMPSLALTRPGSARPTPRSHSTAPVALCGVTPPTSPYSAPGLPSPAGTWASPLTTAPSPSRRSSPTRNTPTSYCVLSQKHPLPHALRLGHPSTYPLNRIDLFLSGHPSFTLGHTTLTLHPVRIL